MKFIRAAQFAPVKVRINKNGANMNYNNKITHFHLISIINKASKQLVGSVQFPGQFSSIVFSQNSKLLFNCSPK